MATKVRPSSDNPLSALSSRALLLRAMQRDPDGQAYWNIVSLLHKRGDRAILEAATALCQSAIPIARQLGADVLGRLGHIEDSAHSFAEEAVPVLLRALQSEEHPEVLHSLVSALGWRHDARAIEPLTRFKTHPSSWVRLSLSHTLSRFNDSLAIQTLIELTRDANEGIRDWATFDLCNMEVDTPALREALVARLDDSDAQTRFEAMVGLAERGDIRVVKAVLRAFEPDEEGKVLFDRSTDTPGYRLLPALRDMIRLEAHRRNKDLLAAVLACASFRPEL